MQRRLQLLEKLEGVDVREMGVQQHEVRFGRSDALESLLAFGGTANGITVALQQLLQRVGVGRVTIDDEYVPTVGHS